MEFIALGHNYSLNHRGESGFEAGQIMGSGGIDSSEEDVMKVSNWLLLIWYYNRDRNPIYHRK